ncbi:MAG: Rrf2 family transcriptional regulator [Chloroflexi bacterium]|nr:Rrf2 family transcriptional regulator [Chloroflexota bacterium]
MRLSAREQTGLRAMIALAPFYGEGPTALSQVALSQDLPLPYLEQVAAVLRRAGLLESVRGARGGYSLSREPSQISVRDVLEALEGSVLSLDCLDPGIPECERESGCPARGVWLRVRDCLQDTLSEMTLADVMLSSRP